VQSERELIEALRAGTCSPVMWKAEARLSR
jgi:hypothetical protein